MLKKSIEQQGQDQSTGQKNSTKHLNWSGDKKIIKSFSLDSATIDILKKGAADMRISVSYFIHLMVHNHFPKDRYIPKPLAPQEMKALAAFLATLGRTLNIEGRL